MAARLEPELGAQGNLFWLGYPGSMNLLYRYVTQGRVGAGPPHLLTPACRRLLLTQPDELSDTQQVHLGKLSSASLEMTSLAALIRSFAALLCPDPANETRLRDWTQTARAAYLPSLHAYTRGLELDIAAVVAAVTLPFHNGRTEGVNTRTKMIKRQMYGRAGFTLLRHASCSADTTHRHHRKCDRAERWTVPIWRRRLSGWGRPRLIARRCARR